MRRLERRGGECRMLYRKVHIQTQVCCVGRAPTRKARVRYRPTFEVVMAFAWWHATARATLPRDGFLHETSMPSVTLVKGDCVQTKLVFGKRAREDTC